MRFAHVFNRQGLILFFSTTKGYLYSMFNTNVFSSAHLTVSSVILGETQSRGMASNNSLGGSYGWYVFALLLSHSKLQNI